MKNMLSQRQVYDLVSRDSFVAILGDNIKVSSQNSNNLAINAFEGGGEFWSNGSNTIYPNDGNTAGLWMAIDFGAKKSLSSIDFIMPASLANTRNRISGYELFVTNDIDLWSNLQSAPNNSVNRYDPRESGWIEIGSQTAANITRTISYGGNNWATDTYNFAGEEARFLMIYLILNSGQSGFMGLAQLSILGEDVETSSFISPVRAAYNLSSPRNIVLSTVYNGNVLNSIIHNGNSLHENEDYYIEADNIILMAEFLNTMSLGGNVLVFVFSAGANQRLLLSVTESAVYSEYYLNQSGAGFANLSLSYAGMSSTVGYPALVDVNRDTGKFPIINIQDATAGTIISGVLRNINNDIIFEFTPYVVSETGMGYMAISDITPLIVGNHKIELSLSNNGITLFENLYFTGISNYSEYISVDNVQNSNNANVANVNPSSSERKFPAVQLSINNRLIYNPDYKGNQLCNFSQVGFKQGNEEIPDIIVRVRLAALQNNEDDAWAHIQAAIDYVSNAPLNAAGYRGAILLENGVFRISRPLYVRESGVIIRGVGSGNISNVVGSGTSQDPYDVQIADENEEFGVTKLISTWELSDSYVPLPDDSTTTGSPYSTGHESTLINFIGGDVEVSDIETEILDQYVGAGQSVIHVVSTASFAIGDVIRIQKIIDVNWVYSMYMQYVDGSSNWAPNGELLFSDQPLMAEREIVDIGFGDNTIVLSAPITDALDRRWGISKIIKLNTDKRLFNVGVEGIQAIAHFNEFTKPLTIRYGVYFRSYNNENHPMVFVNMENVKDGWLRNFTTYHLDSGLITTGQTRNVTIQDGAVLDPVSLMNGGSRRYSIYYRKSQFMLSNRVYSRFMRHAFILDSFVCGPNVFHDCVSEFTANASEPHFRWSSGCLFDNITARIYIQNRWDMGTSHGWACVNNIIYNCTGPFMISQPQLGANYILGHYFDNNNNNLGNVSAPSTGRQNFDRQLSNNMSNVGLNGGYTPNLPAYEYSVLGKVNPERNNMPESLYLQQLHERIGMKGHND
jgi:Domain of unknown function.